MSNLFRIHRSSFVACEAPAVERGRTVRPDGKPVFLRDDHIVLLAIGGLLALRASIKKWWDRWRTMRALERLDASQLRDLGLMRERSGLHKSYRALAELDESQINGLSERGLQLRCELRRDLHRSCRKYDGVLLTPDKNRGEVQ